MEANEEGTLERLKAHRREHVDSEITESRGRIVKITGDGMLVEFPTRRRSRSLRCQIQRENARSLYRDSPRPAHPLDRNRWSAAMPQPNDFSRSLAAGIATDPIGHHEEIALWRAVLDFRLFKAALP